MTNHEAFVGLDVHKETIAVAIAKGGANGEVCGYHMTIKKIIDADDGNGARGQRLRNVTPKPYTGVKDT